MANLSVVIPAKKIQEKLDEPFSPIKTNGFGDQKSATRKCELGNNTEYLVDRAHRNYGILRQPVRRPSIY